MALWGNPELLILDEPTTGLDPESRRQLWDIIDEQRKIGSSILLTTHYLEEAEYLCDRLVIMNEGKKVMEGTLDELRDPSKVTGYIDIARDGRKFSLSDAGSGFSVSEEGMEVRMSFTDIPVNKALEVISSLENGLNGRIKTLSIRPRTLEEVFIKITENSSDHIAERKKSR